MVDQRLSGDLRDHPADQGPADAATAGRRRDPHGDQLLAIAVIVGPDRDHAHGCGTVLGHEAGARLCQPRAPVVLAVLVAAPALDRRREGLWILQQRALTEQSPDHPVVGADLADPHLDSGLERPVAA